MPFIETDMEQEAKELQAMIDADPELQTAAIEFNREYELKRKLKRGSVNSTLNSQEQMNIDITFWKEFDRLVENSNDEILNIEDFPRASFNREVVDLSLEEP